MELWGAELWWNLVVERNWDHEDGLLAQKIQRYVSSSWLVCSVCPSVWGWYAVECCMLYLRRRASSWAKAKANWRSQLEIIVSCRPKDLKTLLRKACATLLRFFFLFFLPLMDLLFLYLHMGITSHGHPRDSLWLVLSLTCLILDAIPLLGSSLLELCLVSPLIHLWMP